MTPKNKNIIWKIKRSRSRSEPKQKNIFWSYRSTKQKNIFYWSRSRSKPKQKNIFWSCRSTKQKIFLLIQEQEQKKEKKKAAGNKKAIWRGSKVYIITILTLRKRAVWCNVAVSRLTVVFEGFWLIVKK